jgi:L-ascorbate metabolism protein UlaG (beta-lactamase superfamily)
MKLRLIRNATLLLDYADHHILIDPYFAAKHTLPSYTGKSPNPMVDLPISPDQILQGVEFVLISHLHTDHFDAAAQTLIPKDLPLYCQPGNEDNIRDKGFQQVTPIADTAQWQKITITRTDGHHGTGEVETMMGKVSGFAFQAEGEPTIYWAGDTILCSEVQDAITHFHPDIVVTHSCGATWADSAGQRSLIVMDAQQTIAVCNLLPTGQVIATHMEVLDHSTITRAELRSQAQQAGLTDQRLRIPADGETIQIT